MKAKILRAAAGAAVLMASVGAANAATYTIDYTTGPFAPALLTTGTLGIDWDAPSVTEFTAAGYTGVTVTGSYFGSGYVEVWLNYASSAYTVAFQLATPVSPGIWGLFAGAPSLSTLLSYGTFNYEEIPDVSSPVPLPAALPLLATALGAAGLLSRRRKAA